MDEPQVVAERARRAAHFPALKIKVGGPADIETLEAVRAVYAGPIRVDANTGWEPEQGAALVPELVRLGVELIEQPFPAHELGRLRWLQERSPLPIVADESAVTIDDLEGLVGVVAGVNVKAHYNLGNVLCELGRLEEAVASYRNALKFNPNLAVIHSNLGAALQELGRLEEALSSCRRALELEPDLAVVHSNLLGMLNSTSGYTPHTAWKKPGNTAGW